AHIGIRQCQHVANILNAATAQDWHNTQNHFTMWPCLLAGSDQSVMLSGVLRSAAAWYPAPSRVRMACAPVATSLLISAKCSENASVLACGRTRAAVAPRAGQTAPKI